MYKKLTCGLVVMAALVFMIAAPAYSGMNDRFSDVSLLDGGTDIQFEGDTQDQYETILRATEPTSDNVIKLPNYSTQIAVGEDVTATNVLTAAECGKVFFLNSATEFATTLPAISTVSAGCSFEFFVDAAPSGADYTIITGNSLENVIWGGVTERETDTGDDGPYLAEADTISLKDGVAAIGDWLKFTSNGTQYFLVGQTNADGAVTVVQAD